MSESAKLLLGPILIAGSVNTFLYGVCVTQFIAFYMSKRRLEDSQATRYLVAWELLIDSFHSMASIYFIWLYMVDNFLNATFLQATPWPLTAVPLLTAMSACPIQLFLAHRVFSLTRSRYVYAMLIFLTVANVRRCSIFSHNILIGWKAGLATTTSALAFGVATFDDGSRLKPVTDAWLSVSVANNMAITVFLVVYLNRSRTGLSRTDTVIDRLIRSAIESAAVATLFAIMVLITFTRLPFPGLHLMFSIPLGCIYTLQEHSIIGELTPTVLMRRVPITSKTLNRRESLEQDLAGTRELGELAFLPTTNSSRRSVEVVVSITQETETDSIRKSPM
ncbi:hypothetical protein MVEN_00075500 [Mycena venus]|uniref:DUF6534 domain-containing protein n=1 Tax=Mycena venus TaxID=2733690 RepID=A0A8H6Z717_9AGAR|nr:hypothetical protein MVEN_00075500 [Mycena venus]